MAWQEGGLDFSVWIFANNSIRNWARNLKNYQGLKYYLPEFCSKKGSPRRRLCGWSSYFKLYFFGAADQEKSSLLVRNFFSVSWDEKSCCFPYLDGCEWDLPAVPSSKPQSFSFWQRAPGLLLMPAQPWRKAESQSAERCAQTDLVIHSLWKERQKLTLFWRWAGRGTVPGLAAITERRDLLVGGIKVPQVIRLHVYCPGARRSAP